MVMQFATPSGNAASLAPTATAKAARIQAQNAELNAQDSNSRLGAEIASLRNELRKLGSFRRAVAAEISEFPLASTASVVASTAKSSTSNASVTADSAGDADVVKSEPLLSSSSILKSSLASVIAQLSHDDEDARASASRSDVCNLQHHPDHSSSLLSDGVEATEFVPKAQSIGEHQRENRRLHKEEMRQAIATLQQECEDRAKQASTARTELRHCEDDCSELKSHLFKQVETFDDVITALRRLPHEEADRFGRVSLRRMQPGDPYPDWDVNKFSLEIQKRLTQSSSISSELEELREKQNVLVGQRGRLQQELAHETNRACELETRSLRDKQCLERLEGVCEQAVCYFEDGLKNAEAARGAAAARLMIEHGRCAACQDTSKSEVGVLDLKVQELEEKAQHLSINISDEEAELRNMATMMPVRDTLLGELEHRDAAALALNGQLINAWREEEIASEHRDAQRVFEEALRTEIFAERNATSTVEKEEVTCQTLSRDLLAQVASSSSQHPVDLSRTNCETVSESQAVLELKTAHEIADLEAELRAQSKGEPPQSHSRVVGHLEAVRQKLREENAEWRWEMKMVRDASFMKGAFQPEIQEVRQGAMESISSGYQRAIRAFDETMGDSTLDGESVDTWRNPFLSTAPTNSLPSGRGTFNRPGSGQALLDTADRMLGQPFIGVGSARAGSAAFDTGRRSSAVSSGGRIPSRAIAMRSTTSLHMPADGLGSDPAAAAIASARGQHHQVAIAKALDTLDAFIEGSASKKQADAEWSKLAEAESRCIASLVAARQSAAVCVT